MKSFKQHIKESKTPIVHIQSTVNPDGQLIKVMSDGSQTPYTVNDVEDTTELFIAVQEVITDIIKDSIPFYAKGFVQADLDNFDHILQIIGNWGKDNPVGYYLPIKYTGAAEVIIQKVIDDGEVHPDINLNAWIIEILQGILNLMQK